MSDETSEAGERRELTHVEHELLRLEGQWWWGQVGTKEQAIIERTGLSPTRAYQVLNGLLSTPAAWEQYPATMRSLERRRGLYARSRRTRLAAREQQ